MSKRNIVCKDYLALKKVFSFLPLGNNKTTVTNCLCRNFGNLIVLFLVSGQAKL